MSEPMLMDPYSHLSPRLDGKWRRPLGALLKHLVDDLQQVKAGKPIDASSGRSVQKCQDGDFLYLEARLDGYEDFEADLCIHAGRVFIRILR